MATNLCSVAIHSLQYTMSCSSQYISMSKSWWWLHFVTPDFIGAFVQASLSRSSCRPWCRVHFVHRCSWQTGQYLIAFSLMPTSPHGKHVYSEFSAEFIEVNFPPSVMSLVISFLTLKYKHSSFLFLTAYVYNVILIQLL